MGSAGVEVREINESPITPPPLPEPAPPSEEDQNTAPPLEGEPSGTHDSPEGTAPPTLTASGLVDMLEMANRIGVGLVAAKAQVPKNHPELESFASFSVNDRAALEALAPAAIPYVSRWLADHALMGLIAFCGLGAFTIAGNMSGVRKLGVPTKPKPREVKHEPVTPPAPTMGSEFPKPPGFD